MVEGAMRKRLFRIAFTLLLLLSGGVITSLIWLQVTGASAESLPPLKTGDILFQTSRSSQSFAIMLASESPLSHMGVLDMEAAGGAVVIEASATTRETPLRDWIAKGFGGRLEVRRLKDLTPEDARRVTAAARTHLGKPYDLFFRSSSDQLYCSELVNDAFQDGINRQLGAFQKVKSLAINNAAVRRVIQQRWQRHPDCANGKAANFDACYAILMEQRLVTPQSIADDDDLTLVFSNYGLVPK